MEKRHRGLKKWKIRGKNKTNVVVPWGSGGDEVGDEAQKMYQVCERDKCLTIALLCASETKNEETKDV